MSNTAWTIPSAAKKTEPFNAGYAVWRELAAELIAFELDDNCDMIPLRRKKDLLSYYEGELLTGNGKMGVSMILCEAMTSAEGEASMTWDAAKKQVCTVQAL